MTRAEKREYTRAAQTAMKENGVKVYQKDMVLLEGGHRQEDCWGTKVTMVDYVMFEDRATGRTWQCYWGARYYNAERDTLWAVDEYTA